MVTILNVVPWADLEKKLRETALLSERGGKPVYPYANATISLKKIAYNEVSPTSLYVLRENLATQTALAQDLIAQGHHPLELEGGLVLANDDGEAIGFVPPIVEETAEDGMYVLDGAHRVSVGRWQGRTHFTAIHVTNIQPDCPSYALPNTWDELKIVETVPTNPADKKHYRGEDYRALYRDFSSLNGSRLRES